VSFFSEKLAGFWHRGGTAPTDKQAWIYDSTAKLFKPGAPTPDAHASSHAVGGSDAITGFVRHIAIRKTATETVNNSAALQNDDDFSFAIAANEVWQFELALSTDIKILSQFRCTWTLPAGASMLMLLIALGDNLTSANAVTATQTTPGTAITTGAAVTLGHVYIRGTLVNAGTGGTAQFQWAQQTAQLEDTKVLINSYLLAHKIG
jgi:hypothetical protein